MIWLGIVLLVAACGCGVMAYLARRRIHAMITTQTVTAGDLKAMRGAAVEAAGEGSFRLGCEVQGVVRPHKNGALKSELGKIDCVWHRHKITRKYEDIDYDSDGRRQRKTKHEVVADFASEKAFFVEDETGKTVVNPEGAKPRGAEKVVDRFVQGRDADDRGGQLQIGSFSLTLPSLSGGGTIGYKHEEWVLRPGMPLYVLGEASDATGIVRMAKPGDGGVFIMSVKGEQETLKTERLKMGGFAAGAVVALIAGVIVFFVG